MFVRYICYSSKGETVTEFTGLRQPVSPDATGLFQAIMEALEDVGLKKKIWRRNWWGLCVMELPLCSRKKKKGRFSIFNPFTAHCITVNCSVLISQYILIFHGFLGKPQNKARGYLKLTKRPDVIAYLHLLLDVLSPLRLSHPAV